MPFDPVTRGAIGLPPSGTSGSVPNVNSARLENPSRSGSLVGLLWETTELRWFVAQSLKNSARPMAGSSRQITMGNVLTRFPTSILSQSATMAIKRMAEPLETIEGTVERILFSNEENHY